MLPWSDNAKRLAELRSILSDRILARNEVERIFRTLRQTHAE